MNDPIFMKIFVWLLPADLLVHGFSAHVEDNHFKACKNQA
tara:strand:- start:768 stop:887 length:120 start_codon:yes stop_codon:yes gene_type:complete